MSDQTQTTRELPESYEPDEVEPRRQAAWRDSDLYEYDPDADGPDYIIDTPPPYPTGNMHIGNALGWCYMDFAARYHRLQGENVSFPQGWDCHGLPTEVKVEENHDIHRTDVSREEFRRMCVEHTETQIEAMRETMEQLGFSQDWSQEYRTMDQSYWAKTQRSFLEMAEEGLVYRDEHPVNWCPRCETAIADAEVETADRSGTLHYITFPGVDNDDIEIATTRPELLPACVAMAVDPEHDEFGDRAGDTFEVPLFGQEVELIADDAVDADFGTGAVMVCTFGDKQDVDWWAEYDLDLRAVITEDGRLDESAEGYAGLEVEEARSAIAADLDDAGLLNDTESVEQAVGVCWRCDTPIEILSKEQWFVEVDGEAILDRAQEVDWIPEHMYDRLEDWTEGMEWDWVISRQRVFATPIPAWQCEDCGEFVLADLESLPLEPSNQEPNQSCPACEGTDWAPETDVMDTWMDSSLTALHAAGWPEQPFEPVQLREQGHDIIRTWAFYTLLRTDALADARPWDEALINGMVFGEDGHKMSKSRDNFVQPESVVEEHSADAFRQALAVGGQPGADIQFQEKELTAATRFLRKLWNVCRFANGHFDERTPDTPAPAYRDADAWILDRAESVTDEVADHMEAYRFDAALRQIREFVWEDLADDYVELTKGRLYGGRPGERDAARHALYTVVTAVLRLLAPFSPHITAELWDHLPDTEESVHAAAWPTVPDVEEGAAERGAIVAEVASEIRAWKSDRGMALNAPLDRVEVYLDEDRPLDTYDLSETVEAPIHVETGSPSVELTPVAVEPDHAAIGPEFRDRAGAIVSALEAADPAEIQAQLHTGEGTVTVEVEGEAVELEPDMLEITEELRAASGETVEVIEADAATILVVP